MISYIQDDGYLFDAHCHLSPVVSCKHYENLKKELVNKFALESNIDQTNCLNMMSTNFIDYKLICELSEEFCGIINPNYGVHPWFSHLYTLTDFSVSKLSPNEIKKEHYGSIFIPKKPIPQELLDALPVPIYLPSYMKKVEELLKNSPHAGIGEIGIDKSFRVPKCGYLGSEQCQEWIKDPLRKSVIPKEGKDEWSPFRTSMDHQISVVTQFLELAKKLHRPVSIHCVSNYGKIYDTLKNVFIEEDSNGYSDEWIDMHSYSGSVDQIREFTRTFPNIKFSLSDVLNLKRYLTKLKQAFDKGYMKSKNVLLESDLGLDGLYWENKGECIEDRYEFLVSSKKGAQNRHAALLLDTVNQLHDLNENITLKSLDENYTRYLNL